MPYPPASSHDQTTPETALELQVNAIPGGVGNAHTITGTANEYGTAMPPYSGVNVSEGWAPSQGLLSGSPIFQYFDTTDASSVFQSPLLDGSGGAVTTTPAAVNDPLGTILDLSGNNRTLISLTNASRSTYALEDGVMCADLMDGVGKFYPADTGISTAANVLGTEQVIAFVWKSPTAVLSGFRNVVSKSALNVFHTNSGTSPDNLRYQFNEAFGAVNLNEVFSPGDQWRTYLFRYIDAATLEVWVGTPSLPPTLVATIDPQNTYNTSTWIFNQGTPTGVNAGAGGFLYRGLIVDGGTVTATDITNIHDWLVRPLLVIGRSAMAALPSVFQYLPVDAQDITNETVTEVVSGTDLRAAANYPPMSNPLGVWTVRGSIETDMIWEGNYLRWTDEIDVVFQAGTANLSIPYAGNHILSLAVFSGLTQPGFPQTRKMALLAAHYWAGSGTLRSDGLLNAQTTRAWDIIINAGGSAGESGSTENIGAFTPLETCAIAAMLSGSTPALGLSGTAGGTWRNPTGNEKGSLGVSEEPNRLAGTRNAYGVIVGGTGTTAGDVATGLDIQSPDHWDLLVAAGHPDANPPVTPFQQITFGGEEMATGENAHFHGFITLVSATEIDEALASQILKFCNEQWVHGGVKALPGYLLSGLAAPA